MENDLKRRNDEWLNYRNSVTDFIIQNAEPGADAVIFGAGRCDDIDLIRLGSHFSKIILMDRDVHALKEAMDGIEGENITIQRADFTGITEKEFAVTAKYCASNLADAISTGRLKEYGDGLISEICRIYDNNRNYKLTLGEKNYDYAVVFGTHSQLNNSFSAQWFGFCGLVMQRLFSAEIRNRIQPEFDRITQRVEQLQRENTQWIIERFNNSLVRFARRGLLLGIETGNTGVNNSEIDGAYNALCDFSARIKRGELAMNNEELLVWPFDENRGVSYDVRAISLNCY